MHSAAPIAPRLSPLDVSRAFVLTLGGLTIWIAIGCASPVVYLSENQTLYIFSSQSQVVAAVFGLTITGYVFIRDQQDRLSERDESYIEIIDLIQRQQFRFILFLAAVSIGSMMMSLATIAFREVESRTLRVLLLNCSSILFAASLLWTGVFVFHAMRPGRVNRASQAIKAEVELPLQKSAEKRGNLEEFLLNFNAVEQMLESFAQNHLEPSAPMTSTTNAPYRSRSQRPTWTKPRIIRAMVAQETIWGELPEQLLSLIRYRNALVHGQDMTVRPELVELVKVCRAKLEQGLQERYRVEPPPAHTEA